MSIDLIAHLRRHVDPVTATSGLNPVRLIAFNRGKEAFSLIFDLIREVELPADGWTPAQGWPFSLWTTAAALAVSADAPGALRAATMALPVRPPFQPDGFMVWIADELYQVDLLTPQMAGHPVSIRNVTELTPIPDRRRTLGQQIITEMKQIREAWDHGRVEECRTRMSLIQGTYEAFIQNTAMIARLSVIERIDFEAGALVFRKTYEDLQPAWNQRPPQWR